MRTLIVYGNCQADAVALILTRCQRLVERFKIVYVPSFAHPIDGFAQVSREDVEECGIIFEQHDPSGFPYATQLPHGCRLVKFPSVDLNLLWPFTCVNPYNDAVSRERPYGTFPYGDRIIVDCIRRGLSADDIFNFYMTQWNVYKPDVQRLIALETARINSRDESCDLKFARPVLEGFRNRRLFWSVNHPTAPMLAEVSAALLKAVGAPDLPSAQDLEEIIVANFTERGPLGIASIPVHPRLAEDLKLRWYDPNEKFAMFHGDALSYEEYFRALIDVSLRQVEGTVA